MWLYNIAIALYTLAIKLGSLWIPKAKLWCDGRRDIFERMAAAIAPDDRIVWIHVASLGEFEQGRPLIEKIKAEYPEYKILLTFFSPSGYELRKSYACADYIFYLPADTLGNARRFLDIVHPEIAIYVKYEFWLNMLFELRRRSIRTYIVSAIFRKNSIFFRRYGFLWRRALDSFNLIFVQNEESKERLSKIGVEDVIVAGDTRFDRVAEVARNVKSNQLVESFRGSAQLLVAGSTWPVDEDLLVSIVEGHKDIKFVIAPHEIHESHLSEIEAKFPDAIRYTKAQECGNIIDYQVLILDTMGHLSSIYHYASWAYIGGGFGVGIHNTLEASTFGLPIAFGPNYQKFKEAVDMVALGACSSINSREELDAWFSELLNDVELCGQKSLAAKEYTVRNQGASDLIINAIFVEKSQTLTPQ
ncbi:MAG: glycosyltransferase N-terminal domain-containing protein [Rikenellaceae bacterium]